MKDGYVKTQESPDVSLHYVEEPENQNGDLVLLLHGFPEFWYAWKDYLTPLSQAGYHPVALDLRGYNKSSHPEDKDQYDLERLVEDIKAVVDKFGKKAYIVGHDWGGIISWEFAAKYPEYVEGLVVMNAPHRKALRESWSLKQLLKLWYTVLFRIPFVAEYFLKRKNYKAIEKIFIKQPVNEQAYPDEDIERYKKALSIGCTLRSALNYYRQNLKNFGKRGMNIIKSPTLLIWGEQDAALEKSTTEDLQKYVSGELTKRYYPNASHWIHREIPGEMVRVLVDFFKSHRTHNIA